MNDVMTLRELAARAQDLGIMAKGHVPDEFKTISANLVEFAEGLEKRTHSRQTIAKSMRNMYEDTYLVDSWLTPVVTIGGLDSVAVETFFDAYKQLMESMEREERPSTVESTAVPESPLPAGGDPTVVPAGQEELSGKEQKIKNKIEKNQKSEGQKKKLIIALVVAGALVISAGALVSYFRKGTSQLDTETVVMKYAIDSALKAKVPSQNLGTEPQKPIKEKVVSERDRLLGEVQGYLNKNKFEYAMSSIREMASKYPRHPGISEMVREVILGHMDLAGQNIEQKDWDTGFAHLRKARYLSLNYGFNTRKVEKLRERLDRLRYLDKPQDLVGKMISVDLKDGGSRNGTVISASTNNLTIKVWRLIAGGEASFVAKVKNSNIDSLKVYGD